MPKVSIQSALLDILEMTVLFRGPNLTEGAQWNIWGPIDEIYLKL